MVADEDAEALALVDLDGGSVMTSLALPGRPAHVIVDASGRIAVSLRDAAQVSIAALSCQREASPCVPDLVQRTAIETVSEPIGLASVDEGRTLLVTGAQGQLQAHAVAVGGRSFTRPLARQPRGIAVDAAEERAYVAHAIGSRATVVSLDSGRVVRERALDWRDDIALDGLVLTNVLRFAVQGYAVALDGGRAHLPLVLAYPGDPEGASTGYGISVEGLEPFFPHEPALLALSEDGDEATLRLRHEVVEADAARRRFQRVAYRKERPPCLLPRGVAVDRPERQLLVACQDLGSVIAVSLDEQNLEQAEVRRWTVGAGAIAVAIDPDRRRAWVWSQLDRQLSSLSLAADSPSIPERVIELPASTVELADAGRRLFHRPLASDGRSCAGCHVDGRADGLTWRSPSGMVATPVLAGRVGDSEPFGWRGEKSELVGHMRRTFRRLRAGKPDDATLEALAEYLQTMPIYDHPSSVLTAAQARGRALFFAAETACGDCHIDAVGVDGLAHRVGTGGAVDTPSLRSLGSTAPYMHDGRFATLRELLTATDGTMGATGHLAEPEVADLIAYLRTL